MIGKIAAVVVLFSIVLAFYWKEDNEVQDMFFIKEMNKTYDYIVVGAGSAGAVIASRLSEDPNVNILLVEAGGSELESDTFRVPLKASLAQKTKHDWAYYTVPQKHSQKGMNEQRSFWPRGRVLGGTSNLNYMAFVRGSRHDYNQWEKEGCKGWSYKDVLPYFLKMEDIQIPSLYDSPYHSRGGYLTVSKSGDTPLPELYRKASEELGYKTVDKNGEDQIGFSYMQSSIRNGERCSTVKAYLRPVMNRPNLHISINTMATKILIENKKAKGLEVIQNNRKIQVYANKEVILSGGAVNSPVLLMLSGVGPKDHLHELGIPVVADLPVGNNLQDHMMFHMKYNINSSISINTQTLQAPIPKVQYALSKTGIYSGSGLESDLMVKIPNRDPAEPDYPDYQLTLFSVAQDEGFLDYGLDMNIKPEVTKFFKTRAKSNEFTHSLIGLHPKSSGTIRLQTTDPFDPPLIDPHYLENPYDIKVMTAAIRKAQQLMNTKVFKQLGATLTRRDFPGICDKVKFDTDEYWECLIRHFSVTVYHPVSTCRMGAVTDPSAVVDPELRVKGIMNLRVADASIMRNEPSGNTNAPCIMIGEKAADLIRGKDTVLDFRKQMAKLKL